MSTVFCHRHAEGPDCPKCIAERETREKDLAMLGNASLALVVCVVLLGWAWSTWPAVIGMIYISTLRISGFAGFALLALLVVTRVGKAAWRKLRHPVAAQ